GDGVPTAGAVRRRWCDAVGLDPTQPVGGPHLEFVLPGLQVQFQGPQPPRVDRGLLPQLGGQPVPSVNAHLNGVDAAGLGPGDAGDGGPAGRQPGTGAWYVDAGGGLDGATLGPTAWGPVALVGVEPGHLQLGHPLG